MKKNKKLSMPHWFWLDNDNCWKCKNKNGCNHCGYVKKERKKLFGYKHKFKIMEEE